MSEKLDIPLCSARGDTFAAECVPLDAGTSPLRIADCRLGVGRIRKSEIRNPESEIRLHPPVEPLRIALVGLDGDTAGGVRATLEGVPCELWACGLLDEAIQQAQAGRFDLVMGDIDALGIGGGDFTRRVKSATPGAMVIVVSGDGSAAGTLAAMRAGATDYLAKPVSHAEVRLRVRSALAGRRLRLATRRHALQLAFVEQVSRGASSSLDVRQVLRSAAADLQPLADFDLAAAVLCNKAGDAVAMLPLTPGAHALWPEQAATPLEQSVLNGGFAGGAPLVVADLARGDLPHDLRPLREAGFQCCLVVPLLSRARVTGALVLASRRARAFATADLDLFRHVGQHLASAVANALLHEELKEELFHSAKLASVGQLAAGVAHQINNPLSAISGRTQMLLGGAPPDEGFLKEQLGKIRADCARIAETVHDLLGFARKQRSVKQAVDVHAVLDGTIDMEAHEALKHKVAVERRYGTGIPLLVASESHLRQLFANLMTNAFDAMAGGGTLTITTSARRGTHSVSNVSPPERGLPLGAEVTLADTGAGIRSEDLAHIFEPFFTTKPPGQGTGLGLAVAKRIVELHGGTLDVGTTVGVGTTFTVWLPALSDDRGQRTDDSATSSLSSAVCHLSS